MDELSARRITLAQAVESSDPQGRLISAQEREQLDRDARQEALRRTDGGARKLPAEEFAQLRAERALALVGVRNPGLLALLQPAGWQHVLAWGAPVAAFVAGVLTDAIGNPHRVDLVSLPLLGIVGWNVVMYLLLALSAFLPGPPMPWLASLGRWRDGTLALRRRGASAQRQAEAAFHARWFTVSRGLHLQRVKRVLHLCAAAWAAGVIASLLVRGLVVEYRVGWESTFLDAGQVHALLEVLRLPASLLVQAPAVTVQEVDAMQFARGGAPAGRPWVLMYAALLVTVVIAPRLLLAAWARTREAIERRAFRLDLSDPYHQRVDALREATRVQVALWAQDDAGLAVLRRILGAEEGRWPVIASSPEGDALRAVPLPHDMPSQPAAPPATAPWWSRWWTDAPAAPSAWAQLREETDLVLALAPPRAQRDRMDAALGVLERPALLLTERAEADALPLADVARCWTQDRRLFDAMAQRLPIERRAGFERIAAARHGENDERLRRSMMAIADHLLQAARQVQEVPGAALSARHLLPATREADASARQAAIGGLVEQLHRSREDMLSRLARLHALPDGTGLAIAADFDAKYRVDQPVHAPQAAVGGATAGAAMGASVDLLAGGLTLGAAAALGALIGGGAAYVAAAWKNRASPGGATVVQASDDMLRALAQGALLQYLVVIHAQRAGAVPDVPARWPEQVAQALAARHEMLPPYWSTVRTQPNPARLAQPLAHELERVMLDVLGRLDAAPEPPRS